MLQTNDYLSVVNNTVHYTVQYKFQLYNQMWAELQWISIHFY